MKGLRSRMIFVMSLISDPYGRYKTLESRTGVASQKWSNLFNERQQPTGEMVEALGKLMPEWVEWMVTGKAGNTQEVPRATFESVGKALRKELLEEESKG